MRRKIFENCVAHRVLQNLHFWVGAANEEAMKSRSSRAVNVFLILLALTDKPVN